MKSESESHPWPVTHHPNQLLQTPNTNLQMHENYILLGTKFPGHRKCGGVRKIRLDKILSLLAIMVIKYAGRTASLSQLFNVFW